MQSTISTALAPSRRSAMPARKVAKKTAKKKTAAKKATTRKATKKKK
jgi:hypothetical protein